MFNPTFANFFVGFTKSVVYLYLVSPAGHTPKRPLKKAASFLSSNSCKPHSWYSKSSHLSNLLSAITFSLL